MGRPSKQRQASRYSASCLRAQAAMEYLVTYGWALLALLFVIAVLISSGAFSPSGFSVQECTFQPDLPCSSFIIYNTEGVPDTTTVEFTLTNNLGFPINITSVTYTAVNMGKEGKQQYSSSGFPATTVMPGQKIGFFQQFKGQKQPSSREFKSITVTITYVNCKTSPCAGRYTTSGRISSIVETKRSSLPS
ncbi:MAG: hypothetical protein N3E51_03125 [Candidatus Micrarchaeota archaeon]|nr:hypothetical protein [Candidatus Micrarchaeota archaeon]